MDKLIFITSVSPSDKCIEKQKTAIDSWDKLGIKSYSVNNKKEIEKLSSIYTNITFVETNNTSEKVYGKPYVYINELLNKGVELSDELICIINADIIVEDNKKKFDEFCNLCNNNLVFAARYNYEQTISDAIKEPWGLDIFLFPEKYASVFKVKEYAMGQPFWDLWFPCVFVANKIPIVFYDKPLFYHKRHELDWTLETWKILEKVFNEEFDTWKVDAMDKYWNTIKTATIIT